MNKRRHVINRSRKRYRNGFQLHDLWTLDSTIATFCAEAVRQFIAMDRHTYPGFDEADTPEKWELVLQEILWSLERMANDYEDAPAWGRKGHTVEEDIEAQKEYNARVDEGLRLFGKYLRHMND